MVPWSRDHHISTLSGWCCVVVQWKHLREGGYGCSWRGRDVQCKDVIGCWSTGNTRKTSERVEAQCTASLVSESNCCIHGRTVTVESTKECCTSNFFAIFFCKCKCRFKLCVNVRCCKVWAVVALSFVGIWINPWNLSSSLSHRFYPRNCGCEKFVPAAIRLWFGVSLKTGFRLIRVMQNLVTLVFTLVKLSVKFFSP